MQNISFNKSRVGTPFSLDRPGFKEGSVDCPNKEADQIPENRRFGTGNYEIKRPSFRSGAIKGRQVIFENLSIEPLSLAGIQESEKTGLVRAGYIQIPDITDEDWVEEENKRRGQLTNAFTVAGRSPELVKAMVDKELSINKPLGRDQRTVTKKSSDISRESSLSNSQKLVEISQEISQRDLKRMQTSPRQLI